MTLGKIKSTNFKY